jgi:hypothetical protein
VDVRDSRPGVAGSDPRPGASACNTADHQAVAAIETPHAAGGADVEIVNALGGELLRSRDRILVMRVAAVDDDVAARHQRPQRRDHIVNHRGGHHQPDGARRLQLLDETLEGCGVDRAFALERAAGFGAAVVDDGGMPGADEALDHVGAHPAEADHADLHQTSICAFYCSTTAVPLIDTISMLPLLPTVS